MKITYIIRPLCLVVALFATNSYASFIASYETTVRYINTDVSVSLSIGDTFEYELLIDTAGMASLLYDDGTVTTWGDGVGTNGYYYDYFYADLMSISDGFLDEPSNRQEYNRGFFREDYDRTRANDLTSLLVGDYLELNRFEIDAPFLLGTTWSSHRRFTDPVYGDTFYNGNAVLTGVREVSSIPEPSTLALLAIGLSGIVLVVKKQKENN